MEGSTVVIKVKHGDMLRRFSAPIIDGKLYMNIDGLREKIVSLVRFAPDTDLMLTYVDEDGDMVALVDDDDLRDVVKQGLNPLRVTVKVNDKSGNQNYLNASSTPSRSPHVQSLPNLTARVSEILKRVPEPLCETLLKLSDDLAAKASLSSPSISELVDSLSKVSSSLLGQQISEPGVNTQEEGGPSFDSKSVAKALESENVKPESVGVSHTSHGKEKLKKTADCSNGRSHVRKVAEFYIATSNLPSQVDGKLTGNDICNSTAHTDECSISGTLENISAASSASDAVPFKSNSQNNSSGMIHIGVRCDGCGIQPIVGPRFKSKVKVDYDLCLDCCRKMKKEGKGNDYIRIDGPTVSQHHLPYLRAEGKLDSRFIQDVSIFDGTVMAPLTPFTKIWRMRNNGTVPWPHKLQLVWIGGDKLTDTHSVEIPIPAAGLPMEQEIDVAVDFVSPELPGRYLSYWRMTSPSGPKFGQRVWVLIQVDVCNDETSHDSVRNLNLNLPPASSSLFGPEIINLDAEPEAEAPPPKAGNSKEVVETKLPNTENEQKFPIIDCLLVGNGAESSSEPPSSSPPPPQQRGVFPPPLPQRGRFPPRLHRLSAPTGIRLSRLPPPPPIEPVAGPPELVAELPVEDLIEDKLFKNRTGIDTFRALCELKYGV